MQQAKRFPHKPPKWQAQEAARFFLYKHSCLQFLQLDPRKRCVCVIIFSQHLSCLITCNFESSQSWVVKKSCHGQTLINKCKFLTTLSTLKACNSPYMQYYFKRFFVLHSSEVIFSFLIKKSRQKAIEIGTAFFFHSLGNPKGRTLDHFFYDSHIRHNVPYKLIPILMS